MRRSASSFLAVAAISLLLAGSGGLLAQVTPTPVPGAAGPGPWGAAHQLWFDLNRDGTPQDGELMGYPQLTQTDCTQVVNYPPSLLLPSSPCANVYVKDGAGGSITRPNLTTQTLVSNAEGTFFTFTEEPFQPPARAGGVRALAPTAAGTGQLFDLNGDGIFDSLAVQGSNSSGLIPTTFMSVERKDVTGDGRPDYVSLPWSTTGAALLGVFVDQTPPVYVPLTDTNGDGWPDTITVEVANGGVTTTTGPALSGPALANGTPIPSSSSLGLVLFAAAVVALGAKLLRGSGVAS